MHLINVTLKLPTTLLLVPMILMGCVSGDIGRAKSPKHAYVDYLTLSDSGAPLDELAERWDRQAREMIYKTTDSSGKYLAIGNFEPSLRYPSLFTDAPLAPAAIETASETSCLLLIGPAADGGRLALSVLLKREKGYWRHSELFARYLNQSESYPGHPACRAPEPHQG